MLVGVHSSGKRVVVNVTIDKYRHLLLLKSVTKLSILALKMQC